MIMPRAIVLKVEISDSIEHTAQRMVEKAKEKKRPVRTTFNDIVLKATMRTKPSEIVQNYHDELWRESVVRSRGEKNGVRRKKILAHLDALCEKPTIDLCNLAKAIDWLREFRTMSVDMVLELHMHVQYEKIVLMFENFGYHPDENTGDKFDPKDKEVSGRFVIGKALADLMCEPHVLSDLFNYHANEWRERFASS
jgi:hypothetical protein